MADVLVLRGAEALRKASFHNNDRKRFRHLTISDMAEPESGALESAPIPIPRGSRKPNDDTLTDSEIALTPEGGSSGGSSSSNAGAGAGAVGSPQLAPEYAIADTPTLEPTTVSSQPSPRYRASRHPSFSGSSSYQEDWDIPPLDRLTVLDLLDNFALPQQLEKLSKGISAQTRRLKKSRRAQVAQPGGARAHGRGVAAPRAVG